MVPSNGEISSAAFDSQGQWQGTQQQHSSLK